MSEILLCVKSHTFSDPWNSKVGLLQWYPANKDNKDTSKLQKLSVGCNHGRFKIFPDEKQDFVLFHCTSQRVVVKNKDDFHYLLPEYSRNE